MNSLKFKLGFSDGNGKFMPCRSIAYPQQAAAILNPYPDLDLRKKQELTLIWFDPHIDFSTEQTKELTRRLHTLNRYVLFYSDFHALSHYLEESQFEKIILVTNDDCSDFRSSKWHDAKHITRFRLYDFDHLNILLQDLDNHIAGVFEHRRTSGQLVLDTSSQRSQRDVRNESFHILYYRMYKQILSSHQQCGDDKAKSELITLCRNRYPDQYGNDIQEFEETYKAENAIKWYTKDSFVYRLINHALRTEDLNCLYALRFYIADLTRCLTEEWTTWRSDFAPGHIIHLYRGQVVRHAMRCELEQSQGKLVSINGYWSTSQNEQFAAQVYASVGTKLDDANCESILFEIEVDLNASEQVLADVRRFSQFGNTEEEVLFDMDATFRLESVSEERENQIPYWRVRMTLIPDRGSVCIQQSIEQRQLYDSTGFDQVWSVRPDINPLDTLLRLNTVVNYMQRLESATLELSPTIEVQQDDAAFLNYIQGAKLILSVTKQLPFELEQQKMLCQATMHLTLSEHLFNLDGRSEFLCWPQRALGLVHFKSGNYPYAIRQWTRLSSENAPHDRFHTMVCCFISA